MFSRVAVFEHTGATRHHAGLSRREKERQTVGMHVQKRRTENSGKSFSFDVYVDHRVISAHVTDVIYVPIIYDTLQ